jgi:uncharacterized membrane protein
MKRIAKVLVAVGSLALLLVIAGVITSREAAAENQNQGQGSAPVTIIGPLPLPVTGSTSVTGPVTMVAQGDLLPYQENKLFQWGVGLCPVQLCEVKFTAVPEGKRLVIESMSGGLIANVGVSIQSVALHGVSALAFAPTTLQSTTATRSSYSFNSHVLAYFEAGEVPQLLVTTEAGNNTYTNQVSISGHFVDVP